MTYRAHVPESAMRGDAAVIRDVDGLTLVVEKK